MHRPALECECDTNYSAPVGLFDGNADSATTDNALRRLSRVVQNIESFEREL